MNPQKTPTPIDCDQALLLAAAAGERILTDGERDTMTAHHANCDLCREIEDDPDLDEEWLSIARMPVRGIRRPAPGRAVPDCESARAADGGEPGPASGAQGDGDFDDLPVIEPSLYVWGETLGRGGMGQVVSARDRRLGRRVAVKELLHDGLDQRFESEVRITARLQHPAIVNVYEAGRWPSGDPFYTMKLVEGEALSTQIRACQTLAERIELLPNLMTVVDAIAYAHSESVIHRDLKPSNIVIGPFGETVVIDWGLAKDLNDLGNEMGGPFRAPADGGTQAGLGTPQYMPPEQAQGQLPDARVDVYALGATLYHLLDGEPPYGHGAASEILAKLDAGPPPPIATRQPEVPRELSAIVEMALARDPAERYPDAGALADDLRRFQAGQLVAAVDYSPWALVKRWIGKHRAIVTAAVAIVLVATAGATVSIRTILDERRAAERAKDLAIAQTAEVLEEQGRAQLLAGQALHAVPYLAEAYRIGPSAEVEYMLGEAMLAIDAQAARIELAAPIDVVALAPTGDRVAVATEDVVEVRGSDGAVQGRLVGHRGRVTAIDWSDDGTTIVTAGEDSTARRWTATGASLEVFHGHGNIVRHAVAVAGGSVTSIGDDGTVRRWQHGDDQSPPIYRSRAALCGWNRAVTLALTSRFEDRGRVIELVAIGGDRGAAPQSVDAPEYFDFGVIGGGAMALVAGSKLELWTTSPLERTARLDSHTATITGIAFTRDDGRMVSVDEAGELLLWDVAHAALLGRVVAHRGAIASVSVSGDGRRVVTGGADGVVRLWELSALAAATVVATATGLEGDSLDAGERGVVVPSAGGGLTVVATGGIAEISCRGETCSSRPAPVRTVLSRDGRRAAVCDTERVTLWDLGRGVEIGERPGVVLAAGFSPDGTRVASGDGEKVVVWQIEGGGPIAALIGHEDVVTDISFTDDGERVVTTSRDGTARIWDADDGREVAVCRGHVGAIEHLALRGRQIFTAGGDGVVRVWSTDGGVVSEFVAHSGVIDRLRLNPAGDLLATAGDDGWTKLWRPDGELVYAIESGLVRDLAFDDTGLLALARDDALEIWSVSRLKALVRIASPRPLTAVRFTSDGQRIVFSTGDGLSFARTVRREVRAAAEVARRQRALGSWRLERGRVVPVGSPTLAPRRRLMAANVRRRYDFSGDTILGYREQARLRPRPGSAEAGHYHAAWAAFDRGAYQAAYAELMLAAEIWPAPLPARFADEHARFAALAGAPIASVLAQVAAHAAAHSRFRDHWLDEIVGEYDVVGRAAEARAAGDLRVAESSGSEAVAARLDRAHRALWAGDPDRAIADVVATAREFGGGADAKVVVALRQYAELYQQVYSESYDARYGRGALAAYDALIEVGGGDRADLDTHRSRLAATLAAPTRSGSLSKAILRRGLRANMIQVLDCYNRVLQTEPETGGTLLVELFINNSGEVIDTSLTPAPGQRGVAAVSACVDRTARAWVFPRPRYAPGVYVRYPLELVPPGPASDRGDR